MITLAASIGLKPAEFWEMTLLEFMYYAEGFSQYLDRELDVVAWHASICVQPHVKKGTRVTPDKLRGKSKKTQSGSDILAELKQGAEKREQDAFWVKGQGGKWQRQQQ